METINIVIIDDHNIFREGIRLVLEQIKNIKVVFDTGNAFDFIDTLPRSDVDVVLMDFNMPVINGDEATLKILDLQPDLKIIALTMFSDLTHYTQMIDAGVQGFVVKKASKNELQTAIETVYYDGHYFSQEILQKLAMQAVHNRSFYQKQLTVREKEILQLICEGKTTSEIAKALFISNKTVETHRSNIFKKAEVRNLAELIVWAVKNKFFYIS